MLWKKRSFLQKIDIFENILQRCGSCQTLEGNVLVYLYDGHKQGATVCI